MLNKGHRSHAIDTYRCTVVSAFTNLECKNRFQVMNSLGQPVYFAAEESGFCMRQCCKTARSFVMHVADNLGKVYFAMKESILKSYGALKYFKLQLRGKRVYIACIYTCMYMTHTFGQTHIAICNSFLTSEHERLSAKGQV